MQVKSFDSALDFMPSRDETAKRHGVFSAISAFFGAIAGGLAASRRYERLTHAGVPSDVAARRCFETLTKAN